MPTLEEEEAFSALRARQGVGARYDASAAPARELGLARRGTAYFARLLNGLREHDLDASSAVARWSRAHVVAAVAFNARDLTRIVECARTGVLHIDLPASSMREEDINLAATLPAHALRNLFRHSEVHLNVEWRDLSNENWAAILQAGEADRVPVSKTPLMRAKFIWEHAMLLSAGGIRRDLPAAFGGSAS